MWTLGDKYKKWRRPVEVAAEVIRRLDKWGPFVYTVSADRNSVYIHFDGLPNKLTHKMRISTHEERDRYGYKWQLRLDGISGVREKKRWSRYYEDPETLVQAFHKYYEQIVESGDEQNNAMPGRDGRYMLVREARDERRTGNDRAVEERERADRAAI